MYDISLMSEDFQSIPQTRDQKRCMIHPEVIDKAFEAGEILPFPILFAESNNEYLVEDERFFKTIIQFSFIVTNQRNEVMLYERVANDREKKIYHGHGITHGQCSLLVSFSPTTQAYPSCEADVLDIYHQEVPRQNFPDKIPGLAFLGLVRNLIEKKEGRWIKYYFYVFEVHYEALELPCTAFNKDKSDTNFGYFPVDSKLYESIAKYKADVQALKLLMVRKQCAVSTAAWEEGNAASLAASVHSSPLLMKSPGLFISHSCRDHQYTTLLTKHLKTHGIHYWIDDEHLVQGRSWYESAVPAERYGDGVIFVVTPHFLQSPNTADEVKIAKEVLAQRGEATYKIYKLIFEPYDKDQSDNFFGQLASYSVCPLMTASSREGDLETFITNNL